MKLAIYGKTFNQGFRPYITELLDVLAEHKTRLVVYKPFYDFICCETCRQYDVEKVFTGPDDYDPTCDIMVTIGGDGTTQFTQTHINDYWKKGGSSALSILVVAKGFANFSSEKIKWENNIEVRNGWVKPGKDKIQKNDDKFEIASRLGISAIQKWYYSTEANFQTQFLSHYLSHTLLHFPVQ